MVEGSIKSMKSRKQNGSYSRCVKEEGGVERSVKKYVRTRWMVPDKYCGIFFVHSSSQVH